jgi:uncharacterized protein
VTHYLCDTSVWIALAIRQHAFHAVAQDWVNHIESPDRIYICRETQKSFLRLLTNRSLMNRYDLAPRTNEQAWAAHDTILEDDRIVYQPDEPEGIEGFWRAYSSRSLASTKLWMDAYLAAFARAGGYRFVTTDGGFRQYNGLDLLLLGSHV